MSSDARPPSRSSLPSPPPPSRRPRRRARATLAALLATTLLVPVSAEGSDVIVVELPPAPCDVCAPGKPPPPAAVQDQLRRFNADVNWRKQPQVGDTIPLGSATRIWFQRAWASGRLQPGVANLGGGAGGTRGGASARAAGLRRQPRASLAARSRSRLADRRSTRDEWRNSRSRRGRDAASSSSSGSGGLGTSSGLGTNRSSSTFGNFGGDGDASGMQ
jgi:hypothetical protein